MNKNKLLFFILLFAMLIKASTVSCQSLQVVPKVGLGINGLDFSIEIPVGEKITIEPAVGLGPSYDFRDMDALTKKVGYHWAWLEPSVHSSVYGKFFYNRDKLMSKDKSLLFNSGNFIGVKVKYVSEPYTSDENHEQYNTLIANLNWGGQHNIGSHWNYSYSVGLGYGHNLVFSYGTFYPAFDIKVAYVLPFLRGK